MKTILAVLCGLLCYTPVSGQTKKGAEPFIEGGKVVVEMIKALKIGKNDTGYTGCKGKYADLCIVNEAEISVTAIFHHRLSNFQREIIILPSSQECCLQIGEGIWTYDLRLTSTAQPVRKGDMQIEGCQNMVMQINF